MKQQQVFKPGDRFEHPHKVQGVVLGIQPMYSPYTSRALKSYLVLLDDGKQARLQEMQFTCTHLGKHQGAALPHVSACKHCNGHYAWREQDPGECWECEKPKEA